MIAYLSRAAIASSNELSIAILTSTLASLWVLDTASSNAGAVALVAVAPEEGPVVRVALQLGWSGAGEGLASAVRSTGES